MSQQLKPDKIPYKFYVVFYRYVLKEFSWTWNLRIKGRRHKYEKFRRRTRIVIAISIVLLSLLLLCAVWLNRVFPEWQIWKQIATKLDWAIEHWDQISYAVLFILAFGMFAVMSGVFIFGAWSKHDPYLRAGLALCEWELPGQQPQQEQSPEPQSQQTRSKRRSSSRKPQPQLQQQHSQQEYKATDFLNKLTISLSNADNPMCWGYAMRLYCEKAVIEANAKNKSTLEANELETFAENYPMLSWKPLKPQYFISYISHNQFWNYPELYKKASPPPRVHNPLPMRTSIKVRNGFCLFVVKLKIFWVSEMTLIKLKSIDF